MDSRLSGPADAGVSPRVLIDDAFTESFDETGALALGMRLGVSPRVSTGVAGLHRACDLEVVVPSGALAAIRAGWRASLTPQTEAAGRGDGEDGRLSGAGIRRDSSWSSPL